MIRSYLRIAWRNLLKDRQFTTLNLIGFSVGLACTLLIILWVTDELAIDRYNEKGDRLYQVMNNIDTENGINTINNTPGILSAALKKEMPEVEYATTILPASWFPSKGAVSIGDKHLRAGGQYIGKDYFDIFTCHWLAGDRDRLFADDMGVAVSERMAKKLFGSAEGAIGKTIQWDQQEFSGSYLITGIFEENPSNATDQFDLLFNYELVPERRPFLRTWNNSDPRTYILTKEGADIAGLDKKIRSFARTKDSHSRYELFMAKFSDRYLYNHYENGKQAGGRITYVRLFTIIAVFILLIACINFMNLSTAKAAYRAKEVGIKKVVGASRRSLVLQYLSESLVLAILALFLAIGLAAISLPMFNEITGRQLSLHLTPGFVLSALGVTILTGLLAGSYPAFYLSAFRPVAVLKGKVRTSWSELWARKGLVVFQFTLSVAFIAAVLIIYRQISFINSRNLGYNRDHIIHFEVPSENDSARENAEISFVHELSAIPGVTGVSSYYHTLTGGHGSMNGVLWPGKNPNTDPEISNLEVGYNFLETMGIRLKEGRYFSPDARSAKEVILNETAIRVMGLKDPLGKIITFFGTRREIIGVTTDFNFESLYSSVKPCLFQVYPVTPNIIVKIRAGSESPTIAAVRAAYTRFNPGVAFEYRFMDEDFQALYASETRVGLLSRCFAGLAIIISCLGLFGLAAFTAQRRKKEIGIRKVVGASAASVALLLSREFIVLVLVAIGIAFPLVWYAMHQWLNGFAYRVDIRADIFVITGLSAIVITVLTISYQSIRAAFANPVDSLRSE